MNYQNCVNLSVNVNELKRIASAYVEDSRRLDVNDLKLSLNKTEGQYISYDNIEKQLDKLKLHENPIIRIIVPIILQNYLLDEDEYTSSCKATEEAVLSYEQSVIDESNNFDSKNMSRDFSLLKSSTIALLFSSICSSRYIRLERIAASLAANCEMALSLSTWSCFSSSFVFSLLVVKFLGVK